MQTVAECASGAGAILQGMFMFATNADIERFSYTPLCPGWIDTVMIHVRRFSLLVTRTKAKKQLRTFGCSLDFHGSH